MGKESMVQTDLQAKIDKITQAGSQRVKKTKEATEDRQRAAASFKKGDQVYVHFRGKQIQRPILRIDKKGNVVVKIGPRVVQSYHPKFVESVGE